MKTVLITGGTGGIGRATVRAFAGAGYAVAFTYLNAASAAATLAKETGALPIRADNRSEADVCAAVRRATEELSHIDCLVNNAGISRFSLLTDVSLAEWNEMLSVHLTGAFLYAREVLRTSMLARHSGRIIQVASMWGLVGASMEVPYSAAKAGLIGFTKALAKEVGPSGITVNAVAPGVIDTDMNRTLGEQTLRELCDETPVGRLGTPEDVAAAVLFLAGDGGKFVTGDVLNVSGGFVI